MTSKKLRLREWLKRNVDIWNWSDQYPDLVEAFIDNGCQHPEIDFEGGAQDFANALHVERWRRGNVEGGAYFTPPDVAERMVEYLGGCSGCTVLDPAAGIGNLFYPVSMAGGFPIGYECRHWFYKVGLSLTHNIRYGDYLSDQVQAECKTMKVDRVIMNPPFGNMWGYSEIALEFMRSVHQYGVRVVAILPATFLSRSTKAYVEVAEMYSVLHREVLDGETFAPLTRVHTEILTLMPV